MWAELAWAELVLGRVVCNSLTLVMLNSDISCFEKFVDPDQLASQIPADQGPHCFPPCCEYTPKM